MKKILAFVLFISFGPFAFAQHEGHNMSVQQQKQPTIYTCPMHPEVQSNKPGTCPKCGMALVKVKPKVSPAPKPKPVSKPQTKPAEKPAVNPASPTLKTVGKEAEKPKPPVTNEEVKTKVIEKAVPVNGSFYIQFIMDVNFSCITLGKG